MGEQHNDDGGDDDGGDDGHDGDDYSTNRWIGNSYCK
jgi:hypothetical protein